MVFCLDHHQDRGIPHVTDGKAHYNRSSDVAWRVSGGMMIGMWGRCRARVRGNGDEKRDQVSNFSPGPVDEISHACSLFDLSLSVLHLSVTVE